MCPDEWMQSMNVSLWDEPMRARLEAVQWDEARRTLLAGGDVVIEWGTWAREERDVLHDWCRANDIAVSLIHLDVARDELARRLLARNEEPGETAIDAASIDEWIAGPWQPPTADELARYDPFDVSLPRYTTRRWSTTDIPFLWDTLYLSIHLRDGVAPPPRSIVDEPDLAHYLRDFGRYEGDDAEVVEDECGAVVAAAYCRRMPATDPGYGFVAADIPELGMAVVDGHRARGVGRLVLARLLERHPTMSLSVDLENDVARGLYESMGFQPVAEEGTALTMLRTG